MTSSEGSTKFPPRQGIWDAGLQPERTKLAWQRTVLSLLACALIVSRLVAMHHLVTGFVCALISVAIAGLTGRQTTRRYRTTQGALHHTEALHRARTLPDGRLGAWLMVHLLVLGVFATIYALG